MLQGRTESVRRPTLCQSLLGTFINSANCPKDKEMMMQRSQGTFPGSQIWTQVHSIPKPFPLHCDASLCWNHGKWPIFWTELGNSWYPANCSEKLWVCFIWRYLGRGVMLVRGDVLKGKILGVLQTVSVSCDLMPCCVASRPWCLERKGCWIHLQPVIFVEGNGKRLAYYSLLNFIKHVFCFVFMRPT